MHCKRIDLSYIYDFFHTERTKLLQNILVHTY